MASRRGVRIHPQDARARKQARQFLLHLLSTRSHALHHASTGRAGVKAPLGVAAMVAHQPPIGGVVGQRGAAPGALRHVAALPA